MPQRPTDATTSVLAGLLAWIFPGAGHFYLGLRGFAGVYWIAITLPFTVGLALGGVKSQLDPVGNGWLFLAAMGVGSYALAGYGLARATPAGPEYLSDYPGVDVAQIYIATAGLLNILALFDALARAQTGGLPVFHHERVVAEHRKALQSAASPQPPASGGAS